VDKQEFRSQLIASRRAALAASAAPTNANRPLNIAKAGTELVAQFASPRSAVASYRALPSEPPTELLNEALARSGFQVLVPIHERGGTYLPEMEWADAVSGQVVAASTKAFRDLAVAVVFTPALAAGRDGSRIGKGKGFYDRFFSELPRHPRGPLRVAIVGPAELFDSVPTDPHDEPVDQVLTG